MSPGDPECYDAFLSYNSLDRPAVQELAGRLKGAGLELYLEAWELAPGREFQPALAEGLRDSRTCVAFLGPSGLGPWQKQEIQVAVDKRARDSAFPVIPVLLPGAERPRRGDVAHLEFLINASWVEFLRTLDDQAAFDKLLWGITWRSGSWPPAYFPAHPIPGRGTFIDGGLWANCPALVGVVEALDFLGRAAEGVRVLSLSTTSYPFRLDRPDQLRGLVGWAPKLIDTFMFGQAQAAVNMATCLLRRGLFHRIDYLVPPRTFTLDNAACAGQLIAMGRQIAELNENLSVVRTSFLNGQRVEPFQPVSEGPGAAAGVNAGERTRPALEKPGLG
jgi:hypothetical protein